MPWKPPALASDETIDSTEQRKSAGLRAEGRKRSARLIGVYPGDFRISVDLAQDSIVLGRSPKGASSLPIYHARLSREHVAIAWAPAARRHALRDLGSRNGTWIGGRQITNDWVPLADGDVIRMGDVVLVYEDGHGLQNAPASGIDLDAMPGESNAVRALRARIGQAAPDPSPVLILGATGTGKEKIAQEVHRMSGRAGSFVAINCATFNEQLIESQLFGHKKGAFTGATEDQKGLFVAAENGTLFLDEIGEMPLALQPKLLRAIQEKEIQSVGSAKVVKVDVRVVAATHRNLKARAQDGSFRQDLYARLALWEVHVPSIKERRADILSWIHRLEDGWCEARKVARSRTDFAPGAAEALVLGSWEENLRGLDRFVHELRAAQHRKQIALGDLPDWVRS